MRRIAQILFLLAAVATAFVASLWPGPGTSASAQQLDWQRFWRKAVVRFGFPLPNTPDLAKLPERLAAHGLSLGAPILIRIFKKEFEFELWMMRDSQFHRFATYPICRFSGGLGPKLRAGDRQAPEGFYAVGSGSLNPNSRWHRSFNLGFPNAFDRYHKRSGTYLMVHGGCSSVGCYAMTNPVIDELWRVVTASLAGPQKRFQVQVFPFRMTEANVKAHAGHADAAFWSQLKDGNDLFESSLLPPRVSVCSGRYVFRAATPSKSGNAVFDSDCPGNGEKATGKGKATG